MTEAFTPYPKPATQTYPAPAAAPGPPPNALLRKPLPMASGAATSATTSLDGAYNDFDAMVPGAEAKRTEPVTDMAEAMRFHRANAFTWQICVYNNQ